MEQVVKDLFVMQDLEYKAFHSRLIPMVEEERIIGVRTPELRKYAKEFYKKGDWRRFLKGLPHDYYEENNLHAFLIEEIKDYKKCVQELNLFLPYVDNWATCDMMRPKIFKKHLPELLGEIQRWTSAQEIYTVRFGIVMLMTFYLEEEFEVEYLEWVAGIQSDDYYIKMAIAWYFATALAKQYTCAVKYLEENRLEQWTHNKAIQKAVESYRVAENQKTYLRTLRRK